MEPVTVTTVSFDSTADVVIQGDLLTPANPSGSAVVCHPHPLYGGSRGDAVVAAMCRGLVGVGIQVLRFDFRGAGGSTGNHDLGLGEREDLLAAIEQLDPGAAGLTIAGYSFGADVALSTTHPAAERWLVVAPPLSVLPADRFAAARDQRPVHVLQPERDQFNPPDKLLATVEGWISTDVEVIANADHFLQGAHQAVTERTAEIVDC